MKHREGPFDSSITYTAVHGGGPGGTVVGATDEVPRAVRVAVAVSQPEAAGGGGGAAGAAVQGGVAVVVGEEPGVHHEVPHRDGVASCVAPGEDLLLRLPHHQGQGDLQSSTHRGKSANKISDWNWFLSTFPT